MERLEKASSPTARVLAPRPPDGGCGAETTARTLTSPANSAARSAFTPSGSAKAHGGDTHVHDYAGSSGRPQRLEMDTIRHRDRPPTLRFTALANLRAVLIGNHHMASPSHFRPAL